MDRVDEVDGVGRLVVGKLRFSNAGGPQPTRECAIRRLCSRPLLGSMRARGAHDFPETLVPQTHPSQASSRVGAARAWDFRVRHTHT